MLFDDRIARAIGESVCCGAGAPAAAAARTADDALVNPRGHFPLFPAYLLIDSVENRD
jgi:hypothetical protein